MEKLAQSVAEYLLKHKLLRAGDRVGVAVSGGADSVALLRLLLELRREMGIVLSVVHFNHNLRGAESDADEQFVGAQAHRHKIEFRCGRGDVKAHAATKHLSLEAAAREMRYTYFRQLLLDGELDRVATAHTLDDQAETVLLRLARGSGSRGLAGIYPQFSVLDSQFSVTGSQQGGSRFPVPGSQLPQFPGTENRELRTAVIRPLLGTRRVEVEAYLRAVGQEWREDSSNRDLRFARNRVRHEILPGLEAGLNPAIREALAETAEIARAEEEFWQREVARVLPLVSPAARRQRDSRDPSTALRAGGGVTVLLTDMHALPLALQRRVVRAAAEKLGLRLEFREVEQILAVAEGAAIAANLPQGWSVRRNKQELRFETALAKEQIIADYEYSLCVPGRVQVAEIGKVIEAVCVPAHPVAGYNPDHLLDAGLVSKELRVRNWRAGDRFWPAHTRFPKKIKELLFDRHLTGSEKKLWPVVVSGDEVVWVRGLAAAARLRLRGDESAKEALVIREIEG